MFKHPFSFNGRIRRTEFGLSYTIFLVFIFIIAGLGFESYQTIVLLASGYWFVFAQGAKRCHDLGQSGFYQLIPFYIFALIFSEGQNRTNSYGADPKLLELQTREISKSSNKLIMPEGKSKEAIGSELLSGLLLTALAVAVSRYFLRTEGWVYFGIESIVIMTGYFTVLLFSFRLNTFTHLPVYLLIHRAIFSFGLYATLWYYEKYTNNLSEIYFADIKNDITFIIAIFFLTYIPGLFFKTQKNQKLISLEA